MNTCSLEDIHREFSFNIDEKKEAHWKRDQTIRDVLIHVYEWHQLIINWVKDHSNGGNQPFLPKAYNWKTYGDMNVMFWKKHQSTPYNKALKLLKESHIEVMSLIEKFSENELFLKAHFSWTGGSVLGAYFISTTVGHYRWAIKKIKMHIKNSH